MFSNLIASPAPAQAGDYMRNWMTGGDSVLPGPTRHLVYVPDVQTYAVDPVSGNRYPPSGTVSSNVRGEVTIPGVPTGTLAAQQNYNLNCSVDSGVTFVPCGFGSQLNFATSGYIPSGFTPQPAYDGRLALADGSPCGTQNEFFGVHVSPTAYLLDAAFQVSGTVTVNELGDFELPNFPSAAKLVVVCEG